MNRTPPLFPVEQVKPATGSKRPSKERSTYWFGYMRSLVNKAPERQPVVPMPYYVDDIRHTVCPGCGAVIGRTCPACPTEN